jgi:hypothetical protein
MRADPLPSRALRRAEGPSIYHDLRGCIFRKLTACALKPSKKYPLNHNSRTCDRIPIPALADGFIVRPSCSRGALHEASGVGQDRRLRLCLVSTDSEGPGHPPGPITGVCHRSCWTGTGGGAKSPCGQVPGSTDQGLKTSRRSVERRCRGLYFPAIRETSCGLYTQGASFGAPSPLKKGRSTKSLTRAAARERSGVAV